MMQIEEDVVSDLYCVCKAFIAIENLFSKKHKEIFDILKNDTEIAKNFVQAYESYVERGNK